MRPARFQEFAVDAAKNMPGVGQVSTLAEAGDAKHPFGITVQLNGSPVRYQFVAQSAPGDRYELPEPVVEGEPAEAGAAPVLPPGRVTPQTAEAWLAGALTSARCTELARVERWSTRGTGDRAGVTAHFHSGARIFARVL
jgi:hypothetical protein